MTGLKPFRILVACKRVIDYAVKIRVKADGSGVETLNVKHSMNPFDEIALEESLRMREKLGPSVIKEIVTFSCGPKKCQETLRTALAMGADRAIHVHEENAEILQPLLIARVMERLVRREQDIKLVILGKQAIDDDSNQTGQILAGLLNWPQSTFTSQLDVDVAAGNMALKREVETGLDVISSGLPLIVTTDLRLNDPRYTTLQNIMKAKSKPLQVESLASLKLDASGMLKTIQTHEPLKRSAGSIVSSVDELLTKLQSAQ